MRDYSNTYFCGVRAAQWFVDILLWERFLNTYKNISRIVELGTGDGGFSLFLCLQAVQRGIEFYTFDNHPYPTGKPESFDQPLGRLLHLESTFQNVDIFEEGREIVEGIITESGTTVLYCDNGNKPREFATFAQTLKSGDFLLVHDWGIEIKDEHINYDFVDPVPDGPLTRLATLTKIFIRK